MKKTNAARLLDSLKISYEILEFKVSDEDLSADYVAKQLGFPSSQIFKTIVLEGDKQGIFVCCIPGDGELDLRKVAHLTNNKKVGLVPTKDILGITGYVRGGCSPLAMKKKYPTYFDRSLYEHSKIVVSAGLRGVQIRLKPEDLINAAQATVGNLLIETIG